VEIGHTVGPRRARMTECDGNLHGRTTHTHAFYDTVTHSQKMSDTLRARRLPSVLLFSLVPIAAWFVVRPLIDPVPPLPALYVSFGLSIFGLLATIYLVPALGPTFIKANLKGRDLLKTYSTPMYVSVLFNVFLLLLTPDEKDPKAWASSAHRCIFFC
jgi:hypothetical protein